MKTRMMPGFVLAGAVGLAMLNVHVVAQPPAQSVASAAPPGTPPLGAEKRIRDFVPASERIALGAEEPTWIKAHGKIHPDVRKALARQDHVEKNLERAADWIDTVEIEGPEAFLGYVYVVVHLENGGKAKAESEGDRTRIRELQDAVLSALTAVDFRGWFRFPDRPALLGFVNEPGLRKLADNEDVRAVGLDDKQYPGPDEARAYQTARGDRSGTPPKVAPDVLRALETANDALVWVWVEGKDFRDERTIKTFRRGRDLNERVLSRLSAIEFKVTGLSDITPYFDGCVSKAGLAKLGRDSDVRSVGLPAAPPKPAGQGRKGP